MYCMGENPFLSDPNVNKVQQGPREPRFPRRAGHLPHRDGRVRGRDPARDELPRKARHVHEHRPPRADRPARAASPPGEARLDWQIVCEIATRMGYPMRYETVEEIFDEFASPDERLPGHRLRHPRHHRQAVAGARSRARRTATQILFGDGFPDAGRPRQARALRVHARPRAAGRRVSLRAQHRPPARALAHRAR